MNDFIEFDLYIVDIVLKVYICSVQRLFFSLKVDVKKKVKCSRRHKKQINNNDSHFKEFI